MRSTLPASTSIPVGWKPLRAHSIPIRSPTQPRPRQPTSHARPPRVQRRPARPWTLLGVQRTFAPELEEGVVARERTGGRVSLVNHSPNCLVVDTHGPPRNVKLIVDFRTRKGMKSKASVAQEVVQLGRLIADEHVETDVCDDRADGVQAWAAIPTNGGEVAQSDSELVDQSPPSLGHFGLLSREFVPAFHSGVREDLLRRWQIS